MARIKFSDDGEAITTKANKSQSQEQNDEQLSKVAAAEPILSEEEEEDSDAAPEEEGFQDSRQSVVKKQRQQEALIAKQRADVKKERRERDEQLKTQKAESVKRQERTKKEDSTEDDESTKPSASLLDTSLLEEMESSELILPNHKKNKKIKFDENGKSDGSNSSGITKNKKKESVKDAKNRLEIKSRSTSSKVVKKGPVTVSVLKKNSKSLMPPKSQVIDQMRDKWYQESQKVVERRARR